LQFTHVGKEAIIAALSNGKFHLEVMKQEPQNVEAALSHVIKFKVFKQSLTFQDHNDGHATCRLCSACTDAGPSKVGETAALCKLIGNLQDALAQATRVMAAMANRLWSGHTTPLETASC